MQRLREGLTLALIVLLPFHAFGVTVLTRLFAGPGHAPLAWLALWKEVVVFALIAVTLTELVSRQLSKQSSQPSIDSIDRLVFFFVLIALLVTGLNFAGWGPLLYGAKYDLVPLVLLGVLKLVPWSTAFGQRALRALVAAGCVVSVLGFVSLVLPQSVFSALGYSDLHSLYVPSGPLAPFQQLGGSALRRVQSVMSGPNQLGIWLLLPIAAASVLLWRQPKQRRWRSGVIVCAFVLVCGLLFTASRSAAIAMTAMLFVGAAWANMLGNAKRQLLRMAIAACVFLTILVVLFPDLVIRTASSRDHLARPLQALERIGAHPFGLGLGTAGPATNRYSDACVHLEDGADASWAAQHPQLCVFVGDVQVQPRPNTGASCDCPFLPENWYLQLGVETGVLGMMLFVALLFHVLQSLRAVATTSVVAMPAAMALFGVAVAGLFLHAWEDAAVAYTVWILAAIGLSGQKPKEPAA
jgi:O-antigen ligase